MKSSINFLTNFGFLGCCAV